MEKKYSLKGIIDDVLEEKYKEKEYCEDFVDEDDTWDNDERRLRRNFYGLLEKLGTNKDLLKADGDIFSFEEKEYYFIKYIFTQLYDKKGIIYDFARSSNKGKKFKSRDVHKMIQELCDEAEREGMDEKELLNLTMFFANLFLESPLRSIEYSHALIDSLALNLQDLTCEQKAIYLLKFEDILKKEFAIRCVELALNAKGLGELIEERRRLVGDDIYGDEFYEYEPELRYHYIERDKELLEKIQDDDDLRDYIEKKLGKKAEEIFNYATLTK